MSRDPSAERLHRMELKIENMQKALGSQAKITEELRASHNRSVRVLTDAFNRPGTPDLAGLLASLDHDQDRPD